MTRWLIHNFLIITATSLTAVWIIIISHFIDFQKINSLSPNELGDFLAGLFAPLAFLWLVIAVLLQKQELSAQREEIKINFLQNYKINMLNLCREQVLDISRSLHDIFSHLSQRPERIYVVTHEEAMDVLRLYAAENYFEQIKKSQACLERMAESFRYDHWQIFPQEVGVILKRLQISIESFLSLLSPGESGSAAFQSYVIHCEKLLENCNAIIKKIDSGYK